MKERVKAPKKLVALMLSLLMLTSLLPTTVLAAESSVVTDDADLDVFMNVDSSVADTTQFTNDVSSYLQWLIDNGGSSEIRNFRINTTAASIDPTDITKWEVYDHYDTVWYDDESAWKTSYHGGDIPGTWYYYPVKDENTGTLNNGKTTIPILISDKEGSTNYGTAWGKAAGLQSHIYAYMDNGKPAMMFYGYGSDGCSDFLYYPATSTSTKTVKFDVDASNVHTHTLDYNGFLINTGTPETDAGKISGYAILFKYTYDYSKLDHSVYKTDDDGTNPATGLEGVYLYKLSDVNVDTLHASNLYYSVSGATRVATSSFKAFYQKSHIELSITPKGLYATIQQLDDSGSLVDGTQSNLFGSSSKSLQTLDNTGYGGFGPYVDYLSHGCSRTSSFLYSNLEMSFKEPVGTSSALEAYKYADYLDNSGQNVFVNLTDSGETNYAPTASDTDKAYISLMQNDKTVLITDEKEGTYLPGTLGDNAVNVNDTTDIASHYSGPGAPDVTTDELAAKVAYQIYTAHYSEGGTPVVPPAAVTIASLTLMDGPGTDAQQVNQVKKELITAGGLNVYYNTAGSQNATDAKTCTLTKPNGKTSSLIYQIDDSGHGYFPVSNTPDWPAGQYKVTLQYSVDSGKTSIPATTSFDVLSDSVAPAVSADVSGQTAALTFTNTAGTGSTAYTSDLDSYAAVVDTTNDNGVQPETPDPSNFTPVTGSTASINLGNDLAKGTHYLHVFLKDAAGNLGYVQKSFTVGAPTVAFTAPATNTYTNTSPYTESSVTFSITGNYYDAVSYKVGTGDSEPTTYDTTVNLTDNPGSATYELPTGANRLWIKVVDEKGNESDPISIYVNAKKHQILSGTKTYTFEVGVDTGATLDFTSTSSPALGGGETLGAITYAKTADPNNAITLHDGVVTAGTRIGTATVTVSAAETAAHYPASDTITMNVVAPFSVSLTTTAWNNTGVTLLPNYTDGGNFGVSNTRELKYRAVGTSTWTTISADSWNWNTGYTINLSGLTAGTEYEVQLTGQNGRTTPTAASATLKFKTPNTSSTGSATKTITIKNTVNGDPYYVTVRKGDTVLYSKTVTGTGGDVTCNLTDLTDGFYNIVVEHGGKTATEPLQIKDGKPVVGPIDAGFDLGDKSTRVVINGENSPAVVVDDLNGLYGATDNTDDSAGITTGDNDTLNNHGGSALIKLVSTGKTESEIPEAVQEKINAIKNGQSLALLVDLSLYKTIWESNDTQGTTTQMTSTANLITIAVPLSNVGGTNLKAYRVHGDTAQLIPAAVWDEDSNQYVWADTYSINSTPLTKGDGVGANEFVVFTDGYAVFHVDKFSIYAIGYTTRSSGSGGSSTIVSHTVSIQESDHGTVSMSQSSHISGQPVALTVNPDDGYKLGHLNITDASGNAIKYTKNTNGTYAFTMPASAVKISASFVKTVKTPTETGVGNWLITKDHIKYLNGKTNGYFEPNSNMTRAQAAQMFYNLLLNKDIVTTVTFSDVPDGVWCKHPVEALASLGVITGFKDGTFKPDGYITRAQFAAIAMRFATITDGEATFSDVPDTYWAHDYIASASGYGWINGYSDGTYRPNGLITRAQVATIVNNMLNRSPDKEYIDANTEKLKIFPDVSSGSYWAYYEIVEATNAHDFNSTTGEEIWTSID